MKKKQNGFTLIELLVVIAIIGILAAIAIPQFSKYRAKGFDARARSDLRNAATAEEANYASSETYITCATAAACKAALAGFQPSNGTVLAMTNGGSSFTGTASHPNGSGVTCSWDSSLGGDQGCK